MERPIRNPLFELPLEMFQHSSYGASVGQVQTSPSIVPQHEHSPRTARPNTSHARVSRSGLGIHMDEGGHAAWLTPSKRLVSVSNRSAHSDITTPNSFALSLSLSPKKSAQLADSIVESPLRRRLFPASTNQLNDAKSTPLPRLLDAMIEEDIPNETHVASSNHPTSPINVPVLSISPPRNSIPVDALTFSTTNPATNTPTTPQSHRKSTLQPPSRSHRSRYSRTLPTSIHYPGFEIFHDPSPKDVSVLLPTSAHATTSFSPVLDTADDEKENLFSSLDISLLDSSNRSSSRQKRKSAETEIIDKQKDTPRRSKRSKTPSGLTYSENVDTSASPKKRTHANTPGITEMTREYREAKRRQSFIMDLELRPGPASPTKAVAKEDDNVKARSVYGAAAHKTRAGRKRLMEMEVDEEAWCVFLSLSWLMK